MYDVFRSTVCGAILVLVYASAASAQNATMSLEVTALNGQPVIPSQSKITVSPGDRLTTQIMVRDFSPNGEKLRAYQATIDYQGYESGDTGKITPRDYADTTLRAQENAENGFINQQAPNYVHQGSPTVAVVDTISFGYRYLGVLINRNDSKVCREPGHKYACGTLNLEVSDDASGTFTFGFAPNPSDTMLSDENGKQIVPFDLEDLIIQVDASGQGIPRIASSVPENGAIIAALEGSAAYRDRIDLIFNIDAGTLSVDDFEITDGTNRPPMVKRLIPNGKKVTVVLDQPFRAGRWTIVTHKPSGTFVRIGCVPGDVNGSGSTDGSDILALITATQSDDRVPLYLGDVNGDGLTNLKDAMSIIDLINGRERYRLDRP